MEIPQTCPSCGASVPADAFFCLQCGKKLREPAVSTTIGRQIFMYVMSAVFAPFGLGWSFKYLRQQDPKSKKIGIAIIVITVVSIVVNLWFLIGFYSSYYQMLNQINSAGI